MLAQKLAKPWAYMTSYVSSPQSAMVVTYTFAPRYGRIYGVHVSENPYFLKDILRKEWGFDGLVMSDWCVLFSPDRTQYHLTLYFRFGTYSVDVAINAGLDLEMPGPPRWRTPLLVNHLLSSQKIMDAALNERASTVLSFVQQQARRNPEVVYGDGKERTRDSAETRAFTRKLAAEGMVLLKNDGPVLPLKAVSGKKLKVAIIGPNAKERIISGGGSAQLKASYVVSPYEGLLSNAPEGVELSYEVGCYGESLPLWDLDFADDHELSPQIPADTRELLDNANRKIRLAVLIL